MALDPYSTATNKPTLMNINQDLRQAIAELAERTHKTKSVVMRELLACGLHNAGYEITQPQPKETTCV